MCKSLSFCPSCHQCPSCCQKSTCGRSSAKFLAGLVLPGIKSEGSIHTMGRVCSTLQSETPSNQVSEPKLDESHCLCLPFDSFPSQGDQKNQVVPLPDHHNSPRLARDALVFGPSAALNRDPSATSSVNNSSQTVPQLCVPQQSTTSQPPHLVSRSGQL